MSVPVNQIVIYTASHQTVSQVLSLLRKEGFSPVALDQPDAVYSYAARYTNIIRIAVPPTEASAARSVLAQWEKDGQPQVDSLARRLTIQLLYSILIVALMAIVFHFLGQLTPTGVALLFVLWIIVFVVIANVERIARK